MRFRICLTQTGDKIKKEKLNDKKMNEIMYFTSNEIRNFHKGSQLNDK